MTSMTPATSTLPATLADAQRRQQEAAAARIAAGRATLVVGPTAAAVPPGLRDAAQECTRATVADVLEGRHDGDAVAYEAIVALDGIAGRDAVAFGRWLAARAADGTRACVAVDPAVAELLAPLLPEAVALRQHTVEVTWVAPVGGSTPAPVALPDGAAFDQVLLVIGDDGAVTEASDEPQVVAAAHGAWASALASTNAQLRRANARLRVGGTSRESAAAAALQGRALTLQQRVGELDERLAVEISVARRNDLLFQQAREQIALRDGEIARLRSVLERPRHRIAAAIAWRLEHLPVVRRLLRLGGRLTR